MKIESKTGSVNHPEQKIYNFIADFRNFNAFIPKESVKDWQASEDTCTFSMDLMGNVGMNIVERAPYKLVKIQTDPVVSQYNFTLWIQVKGVEKSKSRVRITIEPQLNSILLGMVKSQLKKFVDELIDQIEKFDFPDQ